ncbi:MAG: DNA translocase FtsK [Patescibacteria group bacterium]
MPKKRKRKSLANDGKKTLEKEKGGKQSQYPLHPEIKKSVWMVSFLALAVISLLAGLGQAGPWGEGIYNGLKTLFGWGYFFLPFLFFVLAFSFISEERKQMLGFRLISGFFFIGAGLGFIDIIAPESGGLLGNFVGSLKHPFGTIAALVITFTILVISFLVTINKPISFLRKKYGDENEEDEEVIVPPKMSEVQNIPPPPQEEKPKKKEEMEIREAEYLESGKKMSDKMKPIHNYVAPPLSLLSSTIEKPTIGDLRANANIIKRTLESFGISVEMGEINVGPTVTRYTLKPAEGMRLSRITALNQDLALALAAHPIRIEAPIPGKSLAGIEVPNKSAAIVRLGSILLYPDFQKADPLTFALGRDVSGEPIFQDIGKMPHLLVAGATGSGKSITIHDILISLLFKNSPDMLRMIMIDPKRVELSIYGGIPHLLAPVITENKKAMGALRWAIQEMDRRYQLLLECGARDLKSYQKQKNDLPYIVIVIDELADLMTSYGREVEGSIIRLAQMARATGIHLIVSTQRPSVEIITGLIKANITTRIALQVASQIDSRTILDTSGAEKLLGHGDLLFSSAELSKPKRVQGAFITEEEIKSVVSFIKKNNKGFDEEQINVEKLGAEPGEQNGSNGEINFDDYEAAGDDDQLYEDAVEIVRSAKKASASLLQRRLKVGYARAARLIDMMEERGVVGPGEGAKPRDVFL